MQQDESSSLLGTHGNVSPWSAVAMAVTKPEAKKKLAVAEETFSTVNPYEVLLKKRFDKADGHVVLLTSTTPAVW